MSASFFQQLFDVSYIIKTTHFFIVTKSDGEAGAKDYNKGTQRHTKKKSEGIVMEKVKKIGVWLLDITRVCHFDNESVFVDL